MMAVTVPIAPAAQEHAAGDPTNFVSVRANLLPEEVVAARSARRLRRRVISGLVTVLVLLSSGYAYSRWQTHRARTELAAVQADAAALHRKQQQYAPLVEAQTRSAQIESTLRTLMRTDVPWTALLNSLGSTAIASRVVLDSVAANLDSGSGSGAPGGGSGALNHTGREQIGTLTITGKAPDAGAVARYVDALATVHGLAAPLPADVSAAKDAVTFSLNVIITADAYGGRYAQGATPTRTEGN
jgi:Tfp pilus assembly protein PilN